MRKHKTHIAGLFEGRLPGERRHKGTGGGTSETISTPWAGAQPYLKQGYESASKNILNNPTQFFPGSTVVPFSPESEAAMNATTNRATQGSPLLGQAQGYASDVMSGKAFGPGSPLMQSIMSSVRPGVDGQFAAAGRGGSPLHAEALARGITSGMAPYMQNAAQMAPGLAQADYYDPSQLAQVGAQREAKAGETLADQQARWNFAQNEPAARTTAFNNVMAGLPSFGNTSTTSRNNTNMGMYAAGTGLQALGK